MTDVSAVPGAGNSQPAPTLAASVAWPFPPGFWRFPGGGGDERLSMPYRLLRAPGPPGLPELAHAGRDSRECTVAFNEFQLGKDVNRIYQRLALIEEKLKELSEAVGVPYRTRPTACRPRSSLWSGTATGPARSGSTASSPARRPTMRAKSSTASEPPAAHARGWFWAAAIGVLSEHLQSRGRRLTRSPIEVGAVRPTTRGGVVGRLPLTGSSCKTPCGFWCKKTGYSRVSEG